MTMEQLLFDSGFHLERLLTSLAPAFSNTMISRLPSNGVRRFSSFESLYRYSTVAAQPQAHFLLKYLINSLGFSKEEALSTTKKISNVTYFRKEPDLVVNFLLNLGLNKTQIKSMVSADPRLLSYDVDKTLVPKIRVLHDVGISGLDLVRIFMNYKSILARGQIKPSVDYLRNLLGSDEKVAKVLKKYSNLLDRRAPKMIASNVELLQKNGFSREDVSRLILKIPSIILRNPEFFEGIMDKVENDFGISRQSKMFYHGVVAIACLSDSKLDMKFEIFRSFGWSDATIYRMVGQLPNTVLASEDKIRKSWNFFVNELGYAPDYLASRPVLLNLNFEKRVKPRSEVLKILNEKKLNKRKLGLYSVLCLPESKFVNDYLLPYKDAIPDVYNSYFKIVGREKAENL